MLEILSSSPSITSTDQTFPRVQNPGTMSSSHTMALVVLSLLAAPLLCALAANPIVTRLAKDPSTSLYTISIRDGVEPFVVDLAGQTIWSKCQKEHPTIGCGNSVCTVVNQGHRANCQHKGREGQTSGPDCVCSATAYNPVNGQCGYGDLTMLHLSASDTDGKTPLLQVSKFNAIGSCAPDGLLAASLPSGVAGVAGLSRSSLSLPSKVATQLHVATQFALCLPSGGGGGAAIFGGGPFWLQASPPQQVSDRIKYTPLIKNHKNSAYYIGVNAIAVNGVQVPLPPGALALNAGPGTGGVALSTATPYTTLRSDVYRPLLAAFDKATAGIPRAPAPKPFSLCFKKSVLPMTRIGYATASVELTLDGGQKWTLVGSSVVVVVNPDTACFAFVDAASTGTKAVEPSPAMVIGGHQMEDNLVVFDLDNQKFGFTGLLLGGMTTCSNFNFNVGS